MLYIDDQKVSAEALFDRLSSATEKKVNISFKELVKHPTFNVNPIMDGLDLGRTRQRGIKIKKQNKGVDILANYRFIDVDGIEKTVRYTDRNMYYDEITRRPIYSPRNILITPNEFSCDNSDMAVFIYFSPKTSDSPFHKEGSNFMFSYQNLTQAAEDKINKGSLMRNALSAVDNISELDLVFFAKGLGITDVENMTEKMIRAELTDLAISNPSKFLKASQNSETLFDGKIISLIDKGIIKLNNSGWFFTEGLRKGQMICNMPHGTVDTLGYLKNYIKQNIEEYYQELISLSTGVQASKNFQDFLSQVEGKKPKTIEMPKAEKEITFEEINDFKSAETFLMLMHPARKITSKPKTSAFLKQVQAGIINQDNLSDVIHDYMAKV